MPHHLSVRSAHPRLLRSLLLLLLPIVLLVLAPLLFVDAQEPTAAVQPAETGGTDGPRLTSVGARLITLATEGIAGDSVENAGFGSALAIGDFDGDGIGDLVIGVPDVNVDEHRYAGAVYVLYGASNGPSSIGSQYITQDMLGSYEPAEYYDQFDASFAVGDFNGDGFDDLAIGAPYESFGSMAFAGAINVLYGSPDGIQTTGARFLDKTASGTGENTEQADTFGSALAAGDFNCDGFDDIAVGAPNDDVESEDDGSVTVFFGSENGPRTLFNRFIRRGVINGAPGGAYTGDFLGSVLAAGDFDADGCADLVLGVPNRALGARGPVGEVLVLYGAADGQITSRTSYIVDGGDPSGDEREAYDTFGFALATGDFNGDGYDDLAVGAPYEEYFDNGPVNEGMIHVIEGGSSGLDPSTQYEHFPPNDNLPTPDNADYRFGYRLVAADFSHDGMDDLAVGVPGSDTGAVVDAGRVLVLFATQCCLRGVAHQSIALGEDGMPGPAQGSWNMALRALAAGDLNGDGRPDLVSSIHQVANEPINGGAVLVAFGESPPTPTPTPTNTPTPTPTKTPTPTPTNTPKRPVLTNTPTPTPTTTPTRPAPGVTPDAANQTHLPIIRR